MAWTSTPSAAPCWPCSGENGAGKSTLVKIIAGDYTADGGEIVVDDVAYASLTPIAARDLGVAIIFQEFQDAPTLTVAENISLGTPARTGSGSSTGARSTAEPARSSRSSTSTSTPTRRVSTLRVGERQIIEIARALSRKARLLILDEPTAALSHHEAETLFKFIRRLRDQGVAIIYITHRLDEVTAIADRVQVLRDGNVALLANVAETDRAAMIEAMVGRRISEIAATAGTVDREVAEQPAIRWTDAASDDEFHDVSVDVHRGEIVAIYGKLGSGAAEVGETAYGLRPDHARHAGDRRARPSAISGPGRRRRRRASGSCRPIARPAARSWSVRSSENVAVASWGRLAIVRPVHHPAIGGARLSALARQAVDPLAQRSRARRWGRCRAATSRRCCSAAGSSGAARCSSSSSRPAASTSAPGWTSIARCASSPPRASPSSSARRTTRRPSRSPTGSTSWPRGAIVGEPHRRRDHDDAAARRIRRLTHVTDAGPRLGPVPPPPLRGPASRPRRAAVGLGRGRAVRPGDGGAAGRPRRAVRLLLDRLAVLPEQREPDQHPAERGGRRDHRLPGDAAPDRRPVRPVGRVRRSGSPGC